MKIVCISDTHGLHGQVDVPAGDVLVHAGDFTSQGDLNQVREFATWFDAQPHKHKICIAGNHDVSLERAPEQAEHALLFGNDFHYLRDSGVTLDGVRFYGSPWQPEFFDWAFNLARNSAAMRAVRARIPSDTDVLVTHGPPHGVLDTCPDSDDRTIDVHVGCEDLLRELDRVAPKAHIFGHIHEGYGTHVDLKTTFVNASTCTRRYTPSNPPIVIDV